MQDIKNKMQIIYTGEEIPEKITKSIFLAGPSLRPNQLGRIDQWRHDAYKILEDIGFDGVVFSPENRDNKFLDNFDYDDQVEWEDKCLNLADCIVFWVPRDLSKDEDGNPKLPAFTTNVEWGTWCKSGKVVFGYPKDADKIAYLAFYAEQYNVPISNNLTETLRNALEMVKDGKERTGGERDVPLFIWNTDSFQSWYQSQKNAGNELREAKLLYNFRPRNGDFVFLWVLDVVMYVADQDRIHKYEFVLSRTDISSVLLWKPNEDFLKTEVALIKEFRPAAATEDGSLRELVSGSSHNPGTSPGKTAAEEVIEETGLKIELDRLKSVESRQLFGTLSSHKSNLYQYQLNDEELEWLKAQKGIVHGVKKDQERTFIEIYTIEELLNSTAVDWSNLGMTLCVICRNHFT